MPIAKRTLSHVIAAAILSLASLCIAAQSAAAVPEQASSQQERFASLGNAN